MIPAVILAAGAGRRMGGPKALLVVEGETLLQRTIRTALAAGCQTVIAVVGDWDTGPLEPGTVVVRNPGAAEGMASSIRAGIAALPSTSSVALLLAVDQPALDADQLRRLLALAAKDPDRPAACAYGGSLGIPAVLPRRLSRTCSACTETAAPSRSSCAKTPPPCPFRAANPTWTPRRI